MADLALRQPQEKPYSAAFPPCLTAVFHAIFQAAARLVRHGPETIRKATSHGKNTRCIPPKQDYISTIQARSERRSTPKVKPRCCSSSASQISFRSPGTQRFPTASRASVTPSCRLPSARSVSSAHAASANSLSQTDPPNRASPDGAVFLCLKTTEKTARETRKPHPFLPEPCGLPKLHMAAPANTRRSLRPGRKT